MKEWILQYDLLSDDSKRKLDEQLKTLDLNEIESVYDDVYVNKQAFDTSNVTEVPFVTKDELDVEALKSLAYSSINDGKVAVLLMAGGQGTR